MMVAKKRWGTLSAYLFCAITGIWPEGKYKPALRKSKAWLRNKAPGITDTNSTICRIRRKIYESNRDSPQNR